MFILDMFAVTVIKRSMSLLYVFTILIRSQNFLAAALENELWWKNLNNNQYKI